MQQSKLASQDKTGVVHTICPGDFVKMDGSNDCKNEN